MALKILNSLTQQKEEFQPGTAGKASLYVCGPTVYDDPHIGHLRSAYFFELLRRYLASHFYRYEVTFVRNVTDVDDKIIDKARAAGPADLAQAVTDVSRTYLERYKRDLARLGLSEPTREPKATEHIPQMLELIGRLIEKEAAYESQGDVYFDVRRFSGYGKLSHQDREAMLDNVRVDKNEKKRDPLDFALWKKAKEGEPAWPSPWGAGRPGWHIECSAMSMKYLGETFDIHGGGRDLIFPHHENEIAQSEAASGKVFARVWVHHGLITVKGQKMSKSLKNYITLDEVMKEDPLYGDEVLKLTFLGTHYSAPLDYTPERVKMDRAVWKRFLEFFENARTLEKNGASASEKKIREVYTVFQAAMDNDLNTPEVLTAMHGLIRGTYKQDDPIARVSVAAAIRNFGSEVFGIVFDRNEASSQIKPEIEDAITRRSVARRSRDFGAADEIRNRLLKEKNVELRDLPDGRTTWRVKL